MSDGKVEIDIKLRSDVSGGDRAEKSLGRVGKAAKKASKDASGGFADSIGAIDRFRGAVGKLAGAFGMFSMAVGAVTALVAVFKKLSGAADESALEAERLDRKLAENERHAKDVENLAGKYNDLKDALAATAQAQQHQNDLLDQSIRTARDLEDRQMDVAEMNELAGVDAKDPAAVEKRAEISARYAARRGVLSASRSKEDVVYRRQMLTGRADAANAEAAAIQASIEDDDAAIEAARGRHLAARSKSKGLNERDVADNFLARFVHNLGAFFTADFGAIGEDRTEAGDRIRAEGRAEMKEAEREIEVLEKRRAEKVKAVAQKRLAAAQAVEMRDALGGQIEVADLDRRIAEGRGAAGMKAASDARENKEAEEALKASQRAADLANVSGGQRRIDELKARRAAAGMEYDQASSDYRNEARDVFEAQQAYGRTLANGGRGSAAAFDALQKEQREAENAKARMERVAAQLAKTLEAIDEQIKALEQSVGRSQNRLRNSREEIPQA